MNFNKCKEVIKKGLQTCCDALKTKFDLQENDIIPWQDAILQKVEAKITSLKRKIRYCKVKPVLERSNVLEYLKQLHSKYVMVPIDKASNNVAIICKRFHPQVILKEIGMIGGGNNTYVNVTESKDNII